MRTRAQARIFKFFELPPEVRNLIYAKAYGSDTPITLSELRLPEELKVSQVFSEALPFFFENTPMTIPVMSNWCVRYQHLHRPGFQRYEMTGQVKVPRILGQDGVSGELVRFKRLQYRAKCCCCVEGKAVLEVDVEVVNNGKKFSALTETEVVNRQNVFAKVVDGLDKMVVVVKAAVEKMSGRESFNGFTVEDVKTLALCFRDDHYDRKAADHHADE